MVNNRILLSICCAFAVTALWAPAVFTAPVTIPGVTQIDQIKDSQPPPPGINCSTALSYCVNNPGIHSAFNIPRDDVPGQDGLFGTPDDCPHCSYYCAPASIRMISMYFNGMASSQDEIYDCGKVTGEVGTCDGAINTHGVGMMDGGPLNVFPLEVDFGLTWEVVWFNRYDTGPPDAAMTPGILRTAVDSMRPVLWCDHPSSAMPGPLEELGWPVDMYNAPFSQYQEIGHAKVIAGYDTMDTPQDECDDQYLIYDPWPNAVATWGSNPYWVPAPFIFPAAGACQAQDAYDVFYIKWDTVSGCSLTCVPGSGTLPFATNFTVMMVNNYTGQTRRVAGRINVVVGDGTSYSNWKSGWTNIGAGATWTSSWNQNLPHVARLHGNNYFTLAAEDVTPAPFNQPPYPLAGDTCQNTALLIGY